MMIKNIAKFFTATLLILLCQSGYAVSLGELAANILGPTSAVGHLVVIGCYIGGAGLLLGALIQYSAHRENPHQIRLSTPVMLLVLGLGLIALPWLAQHSMSAQYLMGE